jgi:hypothetical protein
MSDPKFDPSILKRDQSAIQDLLRNAGCRQKGSSKSWHCALHGDGTDINASGTLYCDDGLYYYYCEGCFSGGDYYGMSDRINGLSSGETFRRCAKDFYTRFVGTKESKEPKVHATLDAAIRSLEFSCGKFVAKWEYTNQDTNKADLVVARFSEGSSKTYRQITQSKDGWRCVGVGSQNPIYNRSGIRGAKFVVVCEGEKACDALISIGIQATTAPEGALKGGKANWTPLCGANVLLWPDNDPPSMEFPEGKGQRHMAQVGRLLSDLPVKPKALKILDVSALGLAAKQDAFDFVAREGENACSSVYAAIRKHSTDFSMRCELDEYLDKLETGILRPIPWPYVRLSKKAMPSTPGEFTIVVGEPGSGKSLMMLESAQEWLREGVPFAIYALEDEIEFHLYRALAQRTANPNLSNREWQSDNSAEMRRITNEHRAFLDAMRRNITCNPEKSIKQADVLSWMEKMADRGRRILIVDPITAIDPEGKEQHIADHKFIMAAKQIAVDRSLSAIAVTHPKKEVKGIVSAESVAGGAALLRFCHCMLWLQRHYPSATNLVDNGMAKMEMDYNITAHILKSRANGGQGSRIAMNFSAQDLRFWERGYVCAKDSKKEGSVSVFEQRAIAVSQQQRVAAPHSEQTYEDPDDDQDLF